MCFSRLFVCFAAALVLSGCATQSSSSPKVAESSYFITRAAGFRIQIDPQQNIASVRYELLLQLNGQLNSPIYLRSLFENPLDSSRPVVLDTEVEPGTREVELVSPEIEGLRSGQTYKVLTGVFGSPDRKRELGFHEQNVRYVKPRNAK
jgi:hypothetical protein